MNIKKCPVHDLAPEMYGAWPEYDADGAPSMVIHCPKAVWTEEAYSDDCCADDDDDDDVDTAGHGWRDCDNHISLEDGDRLDTAVTDWNDRVDLTQAAIMESEDL